MSSYYLAARYSRREELAGYGDQLRERGHYVTSRWLEGNHQIDDAGLSVEGSREERERFAIEDYNDVLDASALLAFTEPPRSTSSRGGRHVEFGIALALSIPCHVIGPLENVFHCLPWVLHHETFNDFLSWLDARDKRDRAATTPTGVLNV